MRLTNVLLFYLLLLFSSCKNNDPQHIIDKAIEAAGGGKYLRSTVEFDFRNRHYVGKRDGGKFSYERIFTNDKDSTQTIHDFVTNEGFKREVNGAVIDVPDSMKTKYTASINSVLYFALLPYGLNDASVKKKFLGETVMDGKSYYKIEITFGQEGGGEDYQDTFNYWIDTSNFTIGFLAYSYNEDDGIGYRLRKAYNPRRVNGILFSDYINYAPKENFTLKDLEELYKKNELKELSKIENTNIQVQ
ncbi:MAG: DUF6503 family protein [Cyclobacteriaceae bacterium]